jgi:MtN3 and saliva related transmembrane protein
MAEFADLIGTIAGILVLSSFVPQIIKAYRTRSMKDVSSPLMLFLILGMSLWLFYGIVRQEAAIIGANVVGIGLNTVLIILKLKYEGRFS